jgi:hypothetical protein
MIGLPEEINIADDESFSGICNRVCTSLKPSGSRGQDEELILDTLCRTVADRVHKNISFYPHPDSSKLDNLKEHLFLLIDDQEESDGIVEYVYEFLDNVYPQEDELWRLKMHNYDS